MWPILTKVRWLSLVDLYLRSFSFSYKEQHLSSIYNILLEADGYFQNYTSLVPYYVHGVVLLLLH